jgi:repressor LexA
MLNGRGWDTQHGSSFPDATERFDHLASTNHARIVYDNRISRQAPMYEIATGYQNLRFVQCGVDDRDRIREAFEARTDLTREALAAKMRISVPSLGRLLRKERELGAIERDRAFETLDLSQSLRQIPVIGSIRAGHWQEAIEHPSEMVWCWTGGPHTFALKVEGDSMDRVISPGTQVAIDPDQRELLSRRVYAVMDEEGNATLKRFMTDPARLEPDSTNPIHKPTIIGRDELHVIGRAVTILFDPAREL